MKTYRRWYHNYPRYQTEHQVFVTEHRDWYPVALAVLVVWLGTLTFVVAVALR